MADLVTIGEILADYTPVGEQDGSKIFMRSAGGSPANVAVQTAKLGLSTIFIGKVGMDDTGDYLRKTLDGYGVDVRLLSSDRYAPTSIAFISYGEINTRQYAFYRGADAKLTEADIRTYEISSCKAIYFGSISMIDPESKAATMKAVNYARETGKIICYDPNWRPSLWKSKADAVKTMKEVIPLCDVVKVSERELEMIADCGGLIQGIARVLSMGIKILIVTQGAKGCIIACGSEIQQVESYTGVETIDTIGTGDSFCGAFLYKLISADKPLPQIKFAELVKYADFANACASLCSTKHGSMPAMPNLEEIIALMEEDPEISKAHIIKPPLIPST